MAFIQRTCSNADYTESTKDYLLATLTIVGVALLVIGACVQSGYLPFSQTAAHYCLGFGGGAFAVGCIALFLRACNTRPF
ncbi:MAG: hypothetical protein S4CHLAM2_01550 [Chlamydiales bacterium]|nr:hypothetical protein [Chlamydiales bacterium]